MARETEKFTSLLKTSARGGLLLILGQFTSTLIAALGTILIARLLGASKYGIISIAQVPVSLALLFINGGLTTPVTKNIASLRYQKKNELLRTYIKAGYLSNVILGGLLTLTLFISAGYISRDIYQMNELEPLIKLLSISVFASSIMMVNNSVIVGYERMGLRNYVVIFHSIAKSVMGPVLVVMGYGVLGAAFGISLPQLLASSVGLLFVTVIFKNEIKSDNSISLIDTSKDLFRYGAPLFLSNILGGGLTQFFLFLLPFFTSIESIGNMNAALNFHVLINFFITPVLTALFPLFSKLEKLDELEFIFNKITKYLSLLILPIITGLIAFAEPITQIIYTNSYTEASSFLQVTMLNQLFIVFGGLVVNNLLNSQNKTRVTLNGNIVYLSTGLVIGFLLIPRYGVFGYLVSNLIASRLGMFYKLLWVQRNFNFRLNLEFPLRAITSVLVSYLVSIGVQRLLNLSIFFEITVGGIILVLTYAIAIILTRAINREDLENIRSLVGASGRIANLANKVIDLLMTVTR